MDMLVGHTIHSFYILRGINPVAEDVVQSIYEVLLFPAKKKQALHCKAC